MLNAHVSRNLMAYAPRSHLSFAALKKHFDKGPAPGFAVLDCEGNLLSGNEAFKRLLGKLSEDFPHKLTEEEPGLASVLARRLRRLFETGRRSRFLLGGSSGQPRLRIAFEPITAAGVVDYVLPVAEIARKLVKISRNPILLTGQKDVGSPDDEEALGHLFQLLRARLQVDFTHYKRPTIFRRIRRRMLLSKTANLAEYANYVKERPGELRALYDDLLISVTSFFRDPQVFDVMAKRIIPNLVKAHGSESPIRVWVPGCASGEEAYSYAIVLLEAFAAQGIHQQVQIFATDISEQALQKARAGMYPESIKTDVSPERLRRFFVKVEGGYRVSQTVRDLCVFAVHDVTQSPPFSRLDLISCRNLLIYLGPSLQKRVMAVFAYALNRKGFLVLGASEATGLAPENFSIKDKRHKIYLRKSNPAQGSLPGVLPLPRTTGTVAALPPVRPPAVRSLNPLEKEVHRLLLARYQPAAVVLSDDLQIVQFYGDTSPYLEHGTGAANLNILKMGRGNLQFELRKILRQNPKPGGAPHTRRIMLKIGQASSPLQMDLFAMNIAGEGRYRVLFFEREGKFADIRPPAKGARNGRNSKRETVASLREELSSAAEDLSISLQELELANEELQSANEEILSSNEELQSTNEELETAKEELQSSNEELTTLNEELAGRNASLSQVNDDLHNLLASVNLAIVMVGSDLRIRRFTPMSEKLLNLIYSDVGRPISDFQPNFRLGDLRDLISDTIDAMSVKEIPIRSHSGQGYLLRIRSYRTADNKIDGAVLVFLDLPDSKPGRKRPGVEKRAGRRGA